jgi:hypothetical protein
MEIVPETARSLLALDFGTADRQRMNRLAAKARKGSLSADEDRDLDSYINVGPVVNHLAVQGVQISGAETAFLILGCA